MGSKAGSGAGPSTWPRGPGCEAPALPLYSCVPLQPPWPPRLPLTATGSSPARRSVIRRSTTLFVVSGEFWLFNKRPSRRSLAALLLMVGGAVVAGLTDLTFNPAGYAWVSLCVVSTAAYLLLIRKLQESTGERSGVAKLGGAMSEGSKQSGREGKGGGVLEGGPARGLPRFTPVCLRYASGVEASAGACAC